MKKDVFEQLQQGIGKPEDNRKWMVKSLVKDMRMVCTKCKAAYKNEVQVLKLGIEICSPFNRPEYLKILLGCPCGHIGKYTFRPNPLMGGATEGEFY